MPACAIEGRVVTAYRLTPVGASGPEPDRARRVEVLSYADLLARVERLDRLWREEVDRRIAVQARLNRASRVLSALGRMSPRMADVVAVAGREIWRLDRAGRVRQAAVERAVQRTRREIWRLDE